jgi:hypothetical protein
MKLWLIEQDSVSGYDTYDSAVVCAETEEDARHTHPSGFIWKEVGERPDWWRWQDTWGLPDTVTATYIGEAAPSVLPGSVCASFNAG